MRWSYLVLVLVIYASVAAAPRPKDKLNRNVYRRLRNNRVNNRRRGCPISCRNLCDRVEKLEEKLEMLHKIEVGDLKKKIQEHYDDIQDLKQKTNESHRKIDDLDDRVDDSKEKGEEAHRKIRNLTIRVERNERWIQEIKNNLSDIWMMLDMVKDRLNITEMKFAFQLRHEGRVTWNPDDVITFTSIDLDFENVIVGGNRFRVPMSGLYRLILSVQDRNEAGLLLTSNIVIVRDPAGGGANTDLDMLAVIAALEDDSPMHDDTGALALTLDLDVGDEIFLRSSGTSLTTKIVFTGNKL